MAFRFVFNYKRRALAAGKLLGAGLLRVEMVEARLARDYFAIFRDFQSLAI